MQDIVNIIVNNGVAVGIIIYFIYRDTKFLTSLQTSLTTLLTSTENIQKLLERSETHHEDNSPL